MARNRRRSNRDDEQANGSSNGSSSRSRKRGRGRSKRSKQDPVAFWGTVEKVPRDVGPIQPSPDVHAIVSSLGRAPIPGQEATSQHYFDLVYDRAAGLAIALAAAAGLDADPSEDGVVDGAELEGPAPADG